MTSYAEVVLAPQAHDLAHPAFSNLFVQTELVRDRQAILCTRRPRSAEERPPWMVHLMTVRGTTVGEASFETDRMKFIGRGRTLAVAGGDGRQSAAVRQPRAGARSGRLHPPRRSVCSRTRRCGSTWSPASPRRARPSRR